METLVKQEERVIVPWDQKPSLEEETESSELSLEEVEEIVGYKFRDKRMLQRALTHHSYKESCDSYERLEFVGDSVLNLMITMEQYALYPELAPGKLTRLRAANVDTEKLARVAVKCDLHKYLRHRMPMLEWQIREFTESLPHYPLHSSGLIDPPKVLADIVESTIGAIFLDCGSSLDTTWEVVEKLLQPIITLADLQTHPVTRLYELCQKNNMTIAVEGSWTTTGEIKVLVDDKLFGKEKFKPKKAIAVNRAAENAYHKIERMLREREHNKSHKQDEELQQDEKQESDQK
ncbi:hypothetical protein RJ639_028681 [Escallonia herrerae]|uniref:RNase III domain-containing protein n=1 Tax=Escallonia herrerae TaxID=1293975 RepID=A0AA88X5Z5_9ASTE|nr:hypothetical protein RJ639_028681 [Escallonia herrerae]